MVKVPRFAFEKFPAADATLTTTMKSVGEAMAIGRNFTEALQKALRSLEQKGTRAGVQQARWTSRSTQLIEDSVKGPTTTACTTCSAPCWAAPPIEQRLRSHRASTRGTWTSSR